MSHLTVSSAAEGSETHMWECGERDSDQHRQRERRQTDMEETSCTPPNFSWVEVNKVAGLAWPCSPAHYRFLLENGIKHLVCLCESKPPGYESCPDLTLHHIAMKDFTPPSLGQIQTFISLTEHASTGQAVAVHCKHGLGRTGTMLACYLAKTRNLSGAEAIKTIRRLRPGSIETLEQERAVLEFQQRLSPKTAL